MGKRSQVAVFLGGPSSEHEISLKSGQLVLERLDRELYAPAPVFVDRQKAWHFAKLPYTGAPLHAALQGGQMRPFGERLPLPWRPDVAFLGLHGVYGEDGWIQSELEALGVPYTGSGPAASRVAMNKAASKEIFRRAGLPLAPDFPLTSDELREFAAGVPGAMARAAERIAAAHPGPWVIKPRDGGSSVGVRICSQPFDLGLQLPASVAEGPVLVEAFVEGRELTCGVLGDPSTPGPAGERALPPTEIQPKGGGFFDFTAKYTPGASEEITPALLSPNETAEVQRVALAAHRALDCHGYSRSDFILSRRDGLVLLETNTLPGLTGTSLFPQAAAAVGIDYPTLLTRLIALGLQAQRD